MLSIPILLLSLGFGAQGVAPRADAGWFFAEGFLNTKSKIHDVDGVDRESHEFLLTIPAGCGRRHLFGEDCGRCSP